MVYKDLSLKRDKINEAITSFAEDTKLTYEAKGNMIKYTIDVPNESQALLSIYPLRDGNTTLYANVGKNVELSNKVALHVMKVCEIPKVDNKILTVRKMSDEEFDSLLEYMEGDQITISHEKDLLLGKQYKVEWYEGGTVFINRFNSGTFSVQGTSNVLKSVVIEGLTNLLPYKDVIDVQLDALNTQSRADDVLRDLKRVMPNSFDYLGNTLQVIMSPSLVLKKSELELMEYSSFTFPALKGLEGYIKKLFLDNDVEITGSTLAPYMNEGKVRKEHLDIIKNQKVIEAIEESYAYYKDNRHTLFHVDGTIIGTKTIDTIDIADEMINEVFSIIETTYSEILK